MKSFKPVIGVILVFMLGAASGSLATYMVFRSQCETSSGGSPHSRESMLLKRLTGQLELDSQQQERVMGIIHETHGKIRQIRQKMHPEIEVVLKESQQRISALLRPDQQVKFMKIIEERKARRHLDDR
ncbi:MAG: hypothetical protein HXX11_12910 [Desulfuromonadales bacterium]|nr:hypothetical protein [Desulfuromonadales bacterium]